MRVSVLGPLSVRTAAGGTVDVRGPRLRALLTRLAVDAGRVVPVARLVDALWPDDPPHDATAAVQSLVSRLRRAVGADAVSSHPDGYRLDAETDAVDFARLVAAGRDGEALALWRGPALPDLPAFAPHWDDLRLTAVERSCADVAELRALCVEHPAREALHARLMRVLHAEGRRADALAVFATARAHLAGELGVDPGPDLREAHLTVLRDDPPRRRLPAPAGTLVGRADDLDRVLASTRRSRLVTVVGPGGVGKTRLALEIAHAADAVVWVALESITADPGAAVLLALGHRTPGMADADPVERLRGARGLLVLDNCEQVVDEIAALVARLLPAARDLRILATSREPLGVPGEALHRLEPLDPDGAVELFTSRAAAVRRDFAVDDDVRRVCRALDGIPLALELAAARLHALTPAQLAERVDDRLRLLDRGPRAGVGRHRTLRAVVDWSWDLLTPPQRDLLAVLSVFAGGTTVEAVVRVADLDPWTALDLLSDLVDRSLVVADGGRYRLLETVREYAAGKLADPAYADAHAAYYLDLAETAEPLLRGPDQPAWLAVFDAEHANLDAAFDRLVEVGDGPGALRLIMARLWWWSVVRGRVGDVRTWARRVEPLTAGPLCALLARGEPDESLWADDRPAVLLALAAARPGIDMVRRIADRLATGDAWSCAAAELARGLGAFELSTGRAVEAEAHYRAALAGFEATGDRWARVFGLACLANVLANRGAAAEALDALLSARGEAAVFGGFEDVLVPMTPMVHIGRLRARTGDVVGAYGELSRAWAAAVRREDRGEQARVLCARAETAWHAGDRAAAVRDFRRALDLAPDGMPAQFLSTLHSGLAVALGGAQAREWHLRATAIVDTTPDGPARAAVWEAYAVWHHERGDRPAAAEALDTARAARGVLALADSRVAATAAWVAE
ncbi:BTAD domain-containing putative transcriptional regulator [Saccharothrix violaceirubra]|uniref:Putative ATPase/DNA-binding SARP family transcriptional activator n=1 Tax=Saccharothrix violaceirubra TaxID=413306 RepID=A0A7W7T2A5_9PSEU|nr:BTAD domain-containing putative transcriptional regulator [Saccharothrix violaceirubra]MBB4964916.1 putative ATPase/DNA-binding SARP family transcriptional activator [Saccharothrix violaceirubra]